MLQERPEESARFVVERLFPKAEAARPEIALVLGSGLGYLADRLEDARVLPYREIPHFAVPTAPGHGGNLVSGRLAGRPVLCMQGRFHYYEGHSMRTLTYPIRVMRALGIKKLILTNAAGGLDPEFSPGDLMLINDHINFMGANPLIGPNEGPGPRFQDMSFAYDLGMRETILKAARELGIPLSEGVYLGYSGPSFETRAEIRLFRSFGCRAVGMSTVPEVIVANHAGIRVAAISCITNLAAGILEQPISGEEVIQAAAAAAEKFVGLLTRSVALL